MREIVHDPSARGVRLRNAPAPEARQGELSLRTLLTGLDGTDSEIIAGGHGAPPEGEDTLVLGHECLAEVLDAPDGLELQVGDRVVPRVRHGCAQCWPCLHGAPDYCKTGLYKEHGIKGLHGFLRERWTHEAGCLVKAPKGLGDAAVLTEPLSIVIKAFRLAERIQRRLPTSAEGECPFGGGRALLAGTGSLGTLAAFLLREADIEVWGMDRTPGDAHGPRLLKSLGVTHVDAREVDIAELARTVGGFDLVIEATGVPEVAFDVAATLAPDGVAALLGVPGDGGAFDIEGADLMRRLVLGNQVVFGSVNSSRRDYEDALASLARFKRRWPDALERVITHRFAPDEHAAAFAAGDDPDHVKTVVDWR